MSNLDMTFIKGQRVVPIKNPTNYGWHGTKEGWALAFDSRYRHRTYVVDSANRPMDRVVLCEEFDEGGHYVTDVPFYKDQLEAVPPIPRPNLGHVVVQAGMISNER
jgi:hypothetical protein